MIARGESKQLSLELHPPQIKVFRLTKSEASPDPDGPSHPSVTLSSHDTLKTLCRLLATAVSPNPQVQTPYRVWKLDLTTDDFCALEFPSSKLLLVNGKIIEESDKTVDEAYIVSGDAFAVEFKQADGWVVDAPPAHQKLQTISGRLGTPQPLFSSDDGFFNRLGNTFSSSSSFKHNDELYSTFMNTAMKPSSSFGSVSSNGRNTRSCEPGTLGLGNM